MDLITVLWGFVGTLSGVLFLVIGYMAKSALTKISKLEAAAASFITLERCEERTSGVYRRMDHHFEQLRKDINGLAAKQDKRSDKIYEKLDKLNDKLTSHIEQSH